MIPKRIGLFIDGGYLDHMCQHGFDKLIDFRKLISFSCNNEGELTFGHYYTCMPHLSPTPTEIERNQYAKQQKLVSHIARLPQMDVKLGKLQRHGNRFIQKKVDVLFALDLAKSAWKDEIDTAVLFAGDSDFIPAIEEATEYGVKTVLYYYNPSYNYELIQSVTIANLITQEVFNQISKTCKCINTQVSAQTPRL